MGSVRAAARIGRRWLITGWHTDATDPREMARLRSRILVLSFALGIISGGAALPSTSYYAGHERSALITLLGLLALMIHAALRRARMTDLEFVAVLVVDQVFAALMIYLVQGGGRTPMTTLAFVPSVVFGSVFSARRWHLAAQFVGAVAVLTLVNRSAAHTSTDRPDMIVGVAVLAIVGFVVRLQHEQATAALGRSLRGEVTDPLTGLVNRRGLERAVERNWTERARVGRRLAIIIVDVDHFKSINDTRGHAAGDEILRQLAKVLTANLRAGDVAARIGGEEFLVMCDVDPPQADLVAERLRTAVERELAPVTVSIGVHIAAPKEREAGTHALWLAADVADRALYLAKRAGRNQVMQLDA
jgi:diguanylate cyclase (GGDEF)-like protein